MVCVKNYENATFGNVNISPRKNDDILCSFHISVSLNNKNKKFLFHLISRDRSIFETKAKKSLMQWEL